MQMKLGDVAVDVVLKDIKNIHLSVHPPTGSVRISAPLRTSLDTVRVYAISKLDWIRQQQTKLQKQERETPREYLDHESHYVWGKRYLLKVVECDEAPSVELAHNQMILRARPGTREDRMQAVVDQWYRQQVKQAVPPLIAKWESIIGAKPQRFYVQRMKTQWGSCNPDTGNIRLNTHLATKRPECLSYVVAHEMVHLVVRQHNAKFVQLMDRCVANWRVVRQTLNESPLAHADW
jgi:predicted metal-dependent hydrolase